MATTLHFTDRAIEALTSGGERVEYADKKLKGLRLRVSARGVKTFSLLRRVKHGPMERITLGRYPDIKTEQARKTVDRLNGVIADGANPGELRRAHRGVPTFAEFFVDYLERHAKLRKRTWREDEQKFRDYLAPLGRKKLTVITRQDVAAIHAAITRSGHPTVANRVKDLCSSVFGRAVKWGILDTNAAHGIEDNRERSRERFLAPDELPKLFAALAGEPNGAFRDFFLLALLTGARRANVRAMQWAELDLEAATWRIPETKNGEPQKIPLVPEAVTILEARREIVPSDCEFVFPAMRSDSRLGHISGERKAWLRILDRAGLDDVRIHDLRRTMGSWQARTGASMIIIGKSLGHKSQQATAVYARLDLDPVRQAMNTAARAMLNAGGLGTDADVVPLGRRGAASR